MTEGRNRKSEPLPQIYLIRDTDLTTFAYELHIFPGDFLRESEFNMRSLMTNTGADSIAIMGKNHMWLSDAVFANQHLFLSRKYDITRHPNYRLLSDFNEKNAFDIEKFLSTKMPVRPGELYRNYEITTGDLEQEIWDEYRDIKRIYKDD